MTLFEPKYRTAHNRLSPTEIYDSTYEREINKKKLFRPQFCSHMKIREEYRGFLFSNVVSQKYFLERTHEGIVYTHYIHKSGLDITRRIAIYKRGELELQIRKDREHKQFYERSLSLTVPEMYVTQDLIEQIPLKREHPKDWAKVAQLARRILENKLSF